MKPVSDTTICVVDSGGLFLPLALRLAEDFKHCFYFSPYEQGFSHIAKGCIGDGFEDRNLERVSGVFAAKRKGADVFCFPDIEQSDLQVELRSQGIPVWGSGTGDSIELNREKFARILKETGLEVFPHTVVVGVEALREHLRDAEDKFIKISRWRGDMETSHWRSYREDSSLLDQWSLKFGPLPMRFLVCDSIETDLEIGGDTYSVLGQWPSLMLNGLEWKDSAYLSAVTKREDMPEQIQEVMEALSPVFKAHGVANEFSSEIRIEKDTGKAFFTDPTMRGGLPSTGSQLMAWKNISEIVLAGAHGELVDPVPNCQYTAESILKTKSNRKGWDCLEFTDDLIPHAKIASCCFHDGQYCVPPDDEGEKAIGWLVSTGDTPTEVLENLKEMAEELPDGVSADVESIADIIQEIESAEKEGIEFGNTAHPMPEPADVLES